LALRSIAERDDAGGPSGGDGLNKKSDAGPAIEVMRYGTKSRVYGVN
jgi:hypothetical protein